MSKNDYEIAPFECDFRIAFFAFLIDNVNE
jgi:hypothetical protein